MLCEAFGVLCFFLVEHEIQVKKKEFKCRKKPTRYGRNIEGDQFCETPLH